jgi:flagellar biosynthesis/type III secretory pathway protein FliH
VPRLNFRTDPDLDKLVRHFAKAHDLTVSQAARELLRQVAGREQPITRGWHEGFAAGYADAQKAAHQAMAKMPLPAEDD